jgi:hypothetical protein
MIKIDIRVITNRARLTNDILQTQTGTETKILKNNK